MNTVRMKSRGMGGANILPFQRYIPMKGYTSMMLKTRLKIFEVVGWVVSAIASLSIPLAAITAIRSGKAGYNNYWGGFVESWSILGLYIGIILILLYYWMWPGKKEADAPKPKSRKERLAARKAAKKALKYKAPPRCDWVKW